MSSNLTIPVLLLKTKSQPHDAYQEHFSSVQSVSQSEAAVPHFVPVFVPVLEHKQNQETLSKLRRLLDSGGFKNRYGGMIFTSQRAVEGWIDTVTNPNRRPDIRTPMSPGYGSIHETRVDTNEVALDSRSNLPFKTDVYAVMPFPLYVVGPATSRALTTLLSDLSQTTQRSAFSQLAPEILGAHTGNGANLAIFILQHYNAQQRQKWFTFYEAPRLPFIPLVGMGSENYSRKRLDADDPRLAKKPLLFMVGEQRRDIIPKTLMNPTMKHEERIEVDEVEVYSTTVLSSFRKTIDAIVSGHRDHPRVLISAVVVFSPQGAADALKSIGILSENGNVVAAQKSSARWGIHGSSDQPPQSETDTRYIVVAIGPTTRDFLKDKLGFEPDVCATKPSPEGVREGIVAFLKNVGY